MKKLWTFLLCISLAAMTLTACGGAAKDSAAVMTTAAAAMAPGAGAANGSYNSEMKMEETASVSYSDGSEMEMGSSLTTSNGVDPVADLGRKLIRTIHLDVETDDFDTLLVKLQEQINALAGYVEQSDISGKSIQSDYSRRRAYMTVRIPSTELDRFVTSVEENGNVTNKSENTTDVTLQYSDLESRKKSLTIEQDRIWALLEKADTLEAVIALEERLSDIRYQLESMESKLRLYDNQVEYSTVYVNVSEVKVYTPTAPETLLERIENGFTRNVEKMKTSAEDLFVLVLTTIPMWLPVFVVILLVLIIVRRKKTLKHFKQKMSNVPSEYPPEFTGTSESEKGSDK